MKLLGLFLSCLIACGNEERIAPVERSYSGQWLQLDQYFEDSCFILDEEIKTVWVFDAGEDEQTNKDEWVWVYDSLDMYTFDGRVDLYVKPIENSCWLMSIWGVDVTACPCVLEIPPKPVG